MSSQYAHVSPRNGLQAGWEIKPGRKREVQAAARKAAKARQAWEQTPYQKRVEILDQTIFEIHTRSDELAVLIAQDTGKAIAECRREIEFGLELIGSAVRQWQTNSEPAARGAGWVAYRRPLGVVALITPWNNPLAIPLGKIAPALLAGNTVVWKPALPGTRVAQELNFLLDLAWLPTGVLTLLPGDHQTARLLIEEPSVDAVTLTGSTAAGREARHACASRGVPFQGELGGNNAAIVWHDAPVTAPAMLIARGGFGAAGQRCTANRRAIVLGDIHQEFVNALVQQTQALAWGDPLLETTQVGPVISADALACITAAVERARDQGHTILQPHLNAAKSHRPRVGFYYPPTIVLCDDPSAEIVREETFGPVIVVQKASDWNDAIDLCNGVGQGLVAAVFTEQDELWLDFQNKAQAGILKRNEATAGVLPDAPFGGWKSSGVGPPEHGPADLEFYTRWQTVYTP